MVNLERKRLSYNLIANVDQWNWPLIHNNLRIYSLVNELDITSIDNTPKRTSVHILKVNYMHNMAKHIQ